VFNYRLRKASSWLVPDRIYAKIAFLKHHGHLPRRSPATFNEHLCSLVGSGKLEELRPYADKLQAREYIAQKIGEKYLVPLYSVAEKLTADVWNDLPESFVIKPNHGSGWHCVIRRKSESSLDAAIGVTQDWLMKDFYYVRRESQYRNVKRFLMFEKLLGTNLDGTITNYRFFCFRGTPAFVQVSLQQPSKRRLLYDLAWNKLDIKYKYSNAGTIPRPQNLEEMRQVAQSLAEGFEFVRVDLYDTSEGVFFGELTFLPTAAADGFDPMEFDEFLGKCWSVPTRNGEFDFCRWRANSNSSQNGSDPEI